MRDFLKFWWKCARFASQGNMAFANDWQWLFGIPAISGLIGFIAAQSGKISLSTGYPIADGVLTAFSAFVVTWTVAFIGRFLNAPVVFDAQLRGTIAQYSNSNPTRSPSFNVFIEEIPQEDADRNSLYDVEHLFRVGITNRDVDRTFEAFAVLEDISPSLGISPAARLSFMGRGCDVRTCAIAPTETAYLLLLERQTKKFRGFAEDENFEPYVEFSVHSSEEDVTSRAITSIRREEKRLGELQRGQDYSGALAIHATGAISCRLQFLVQIKVDGTVKVSSKGCVA